MRQAIVTKYLPPTDHHGSRVVATAQAGRATIPWDYALDPAGNHEAAAQAFRDVKGWTGDWIGGALPDGRYVFVQLPA